jgi:hypothetical protein
VAPSQDEPGHQHLALTAARAAYDAFRKAHKVGRPQTEPKEKKMSCIDAAAQVLAEAGKSMTCGEMVEAMASKGLWSSPGGSTPSATLYSALLREIGVKGDQSRFTKDGPGKFSRK